MRGKRTIGGGRLALRCVLHQTVLVASIRNKDLKVFADQLRKEGKPHKVVVTAVARKLVPIHSFRAAAIGRLRMRPRAWRAHREVGPAQDLADLLDHIRGKLGDVGEGALLDLAALPAGLADQDRGPRVAVGDASTNMNTLYHKTSHV